MLSQSDDTPKGDVTVLRADRARSNRVGRWFVVSAASVIVLVVLIGFMINDYSSTVESSAGARQGVLAVFTAGLLVGGAMAIHWIIGLMAPGLLRVPWTVGLGALAAWVGRGYIEAASKVPGGTDGISVGVRIGILAVILFAIVGLVAKLLLNKKHTDAT